MTQEQQDAALKLAELLLSFGEKTEATNLPYWYVAQNGNATSRGPVKISRGIWFNRDAAEEHLKNKSYRYPKTAFVYCDSGHDSWHLRQAYDLAREVLYPPAIIIEATEVTFFEAGSQQAIMPGMSRTEEEMDRQAGQTPEERING